MLGCLDKTTIVITGVLNISRDDLQNILKELGARVTGIYWGGCVRFSEQEN